MSRLSATHLLHRTALATALALAVTAVPVAAQDNAAAPSPALNVDNAALVAAGPAEDVNDPLEPVNRAIFWVNEGLDVVIIRPAAKVYRTVLPTPVQKGVRNVLRNLRSPWT